MSRVGIFMAGVLSGTALMFFIDFTTRSETTAPTPNYLAAPTDAPPATAPEVVNREKPMAEDPPAQALQEPPAGVTPVTEQPVQESAAPATPVPQSGLLIPVQGIEASQLSDTFTESRGSGRVHDAIDIMAPRGTTVLAVDDGRVVKLFTSVPGGLTVYQFDPTEKFAYYYAHLDRYASGVVEGRMLKRGDVLGYVGSTGNASPAAPHLHFAIVVLGPEKRWWEGTAINPYPLLTGHHESRDD